ncbi:hypothetical protein NW768_005020 [Fusarium equiseti]|uniref:Uncharacterized protein n=1 Tax=Fusarium equiseti TaxID=61235 RepID=A0ABQ8RE24_FUSEQ|nr:hypothetical protein NW768_005020 [Fusarium equiseti]
MSNPIDASAQHADDSRNVTAPTKPSLRVSELGSSATREQDLANGPLLLGLGDGHNDHAAYPEMDLGSPTPELYRPEESILPMMPPRLPRVTGTESLTQSTITESGPSYSTPPGSHAPASVRSLREESAGTPVTQCSGITVFPWSNEFSWNDKSGLCFGGDPLEISRTSEDHYSKVDPGSESAYSQPHEPAMKVFAHHVPDDDFIRYGLAGMGAYAEHSSPTELPEDLEAAFEICSISSGTTSVSGTTDSDTPMESFHNDPIIIMQQRVDCTVELLVDNFFRSYAPRSSKGRATGKARKGIQTTPDNSPSERPGPSREGKARPNPRKRKALVGDEGSEDEDSQRTSRIPAGIELAEDSLGWACPFVKWKPGMYDCSVAPKEIRKLKGHIKNIHWDEYCDNCFVKNPPARHDEQLCVPSQPGPGFITREMKDKIFQRESCLVPHKEQWNRIYGVLFPGEEVCKTPYLDKETMDQVMTAKEYRDSLDCEDIIEEELAECNLRENTRKRVIKRIRKSLIPKLVQRIKLGLERETLAQLAQDDLQTAGPPQDDLLEGSSSGETPAALDSRGQASARSQDKIITNHLFPALEPPQASIYDPGNKSLFTPAQSRSETTQCSQTRTLSTERTATEAGLVQDDLQRPRNEFSIPNKLDELVSRGVITCDQQASTGVSTRGVHTSNALSSFLYANDPWFGAEPADSRHDQDAKVDPYSDDFLDDLSWHKKYEHGGDQVDEVSNA